MTEYSNKKTFVGSLAQDIGIGAAVKFCFRFGCFSPNDTLRRTDKGYFYFFCIKV